MSIGLDRDRVKRQQKLTNVKNIKDKFHVTIMLINVFGFAEHQEKAIYGVGYKLTLSWNTDEAFLNKSSRTADARNTYDKIHWYRTH